MLSLRPMCICFYDIRWVPSPMRLCRGLQRTIVGACYRTVEVAPTTCSVAALDNG